MIKCHLCQKYIRLRKSTRFNTCCSSIIDGRFSRLLEKGISNRFYSVIDEFFKITGIPLILNTSFNENEPIVCKPEEAIECFLRTNMDILILELCN